MYKYMCISFHNFYITLLVTVRFLLSVFCSPIKKEVLFAVNTFSKMCLTNNRKYQANYVMKTKLINNGAVVSVC